METAPWPSDPFSRANDEACLSPLCGALEASEKEDKDDDEDDDGGNIREVPIEGSLDRPSFSFSGGAGWLDDPRGVVRRHDLSFGITSTTCSASIEGPLFFGFCRIAGALAGCPSPSPSPPLPFLFIIIFDPARVPLPKEEEGNAEGRSGGSGNPRVDETVDPGSDRPHASPSLACGVSLLSIGVRPGPSMSRSESVLACGGAVGATEKDAMPLVVVMVVVVGIVGGRELGGPPSPLETKPPPNTENEDDEDEEESVELSILPSPASTAVRGWTSFVVLDDSTSLSLCDGPPLLPAGAPTPEEEEEEVEEEDPIQNGSVWLAFCCFSSFSTSHSCSSRFGGVMGELKKKRPSTSSTFNSEGSDVSSLLARLVPLLGFHLVNESGGVWLDDRSTCSLEQGLRVPLPALLSERSGGHTSSRFTFVASCRGEEQSRQPSSSTSLGGPVEVVYFPSMVFREVGWCITAAQLFRIPVRSSSSLVAFTTSGMGENTSAIDEEELL